VTSAVARPGEPGGDRHGARPQRDGTHFDRGSSSGCRSRRLVTAAGGENEGRSNGEGLQQDVQLRNVEPHLPNL
jgi:hypothetical protein